MSSEKSLASSFSTFTPDEITNFVDHGKVLHFNFPNGACLCVAKFDAGWCWSKDMKPLLDSDTTSCPMTHSGFCVKGHIKITMDSGDTMDITEGQVFYIAPGHDAEADRETILLDF